MTLHRSTTGLIATSVLSIALSTQVAAAALTESVREANGRFQQVSAAVDEGYSPIPCASGANGGAMGIHYVNSEYLMDGVIDIAKPEAILYEPLEGGALELVAVEYIAFEGPASLKGHLFNFYNAPNRYGLDPFYELHVWAWRENPMGDFADMNADVSCEAVEAE